MNYSLVIKESIEFIEKNIKEDITARIVANNAGYSLYHFCRLFQNCLGVTVMDYIRLRRLSLARAELGSGKRVIDIALDHGFKTHSGFTKSFKKEYGLSPKQLSSNVSSFNQSINMHTANPLIEIALAKRPAFKIAGFGIETNIASVSYNKDVRAFWSEYTTEGWECELYKTLNPPKHGEVGICIPSQNDGTVIYILGVVVDDFSKVTEKMMTFEIPAASYAVFTTPPINTSKTNPNAKQDFSDSIRETWQYIFKSWFSSKDYELDTSKYEFEFYDERCHFRTDTVMDIYIPII